MTEIVPWLNTVAMPTSERARLWRPTKRALQLALGAIWLVDAGLQFQPYMFSRQFITETIEPAAAGNPWLVARPIMWAAHLAAGHLALANAAFALLQLLIAVGLFYRRTVKAALLTSIVWSVIVWWLGEGFGGLLTGASPLTGLPGAVILYALVAWLVWPGAPDQPGGGSRGSRPLRPPPNHPSQHSREKIGDRLAWMVLWAVLGSYQLLAANRAPDAVSETFWNSASGEPAVVRSLESNLAALTAAHGRAASFVIWGLCLVTAVGVASVRLTRPALILGGLLGALFWIAQGFGGLATGQATDPNSGPLLILLAACLWPAVRPSSPRLRRPAGERMGAGGPDGQEGGARHDIADDRPPACADDPDDRSSQRAPRRDGGPVREPPAHPHRPRRHRQDPAGPCCRGCGPGFVPAGGLLDRAGPGR
ncbi:MAG TPA: hypothetical protein VFI65_11485 [Streptosporangiaceae bacterium]|nr:hypothetical protein [Streptosporangiaceae bacterium]